MTTSNGMERGPCHGSEQSPHPTGKPGTNENEHPEHEPQAGHEPHSGHGWHGGHGLMMIVCCIPMLAIAGVLVLTGVAGTGIIVSALLCTAMMAAMMIAMPGGHGGHK